MRDPDNLVYFREEVGGLCMGGYERDPEPWSLDGVPSDFNGKLLPPDWPRFAPIMEGAVRRVPAIADAEVTRLINGPEAFTPDNEFILGESGVRGFFVAAGFCAHGIAGAGGIGQQLAQWIVTGEPELDLWKMDIRRFGSPVRLAGVHPRSDVRDLRDLLRHPLPQRGAPGRTAAARVAGLRALGTLGAEFGEKAGWERPNWFTINEPLGDEALRPRGWAGQHWSPAIGAEAMAARTTAALFDESSFAKIEVSGRWRPGLPAAPLRQRHGPTRRQRDVHADAQHARRHRVRLHGQPPGRRPLPDRDRHRVRQPRPRLDPRPPAGRRLRSASST